MNMRLLDYMNKFIFHEFNTVIQPVFVKHVLLILVSEIDVTLSWRFISDGIEGRKETVTIQVDR